MLFVAESAWYLSRFEGTDETRMAYPNRQFQTWTVEGIKEGIEIQAGQSQEMQDSGAKVEAINTTESDSEQPDERRERLPRRRFAYQPLKSSNSEPALWSNDRDLGPGPAVSQYKAIIQRV